MTPNQNPTATPTETPTPQDPQGEAPAPVATVPAQPAPQVVPMEQPQAPIIMNQPPVVTLPQAPITQAPQAVPTTMGDRLSTGAVNAGLVGFAGLAVTAGLQGVRKLMDKAKVKNIKLFPKTGLWITGILAAGAGLYTAFTANRGEEVMREEAFERAQRKLEDPNSTLPEAQRIAQFQKDVGLIMDEKATAETLTRVAADAPQASFQDRVAESRAVAANQQLGG